MNLIIFDLDGTLIDSKLDLAQAVNATRIEMKLPPIEAELIYSYVGNGAPTLIRRALGPDATEQDVQKALDYFIEYYQLHCLDMTKLYPGVKETLDQLKKHGKTLTVLSNKPVRISKLILDGLGVGDCFVRVYGGNSFAEKKPHPVGVETLRAEFPCPLERTLLVGDSAVDMQTAKAAGVRSCGVTYGFQPEAFKDNPPEFVIDRFEDLLSIVQSDTPTGGEAIPSAPPPTTMPNLTEA